MKLLVTGAYGFIGRHLLHCLPGNIRVFAPGREQLNLLDSSNVDKTLANIRPSHCLHLAWHTGANYANSPANADWLAAGRHLVESFYRHGGKRFVGMGTCYEYADSPLPHAEDEACAVPATPYGQAKLALGQFLQNHCENEALSWAWARAFFITGPGENPSRLVPSLIEALARGRDFLIKSPKRYLDYMDARDVAACISKLLFSPHAGIFNICSGQGLYLENLADKLLQIGQFPGRVIYGNEEQRPMHCLGDNSRMARLLDFTPAYSLETTLADAITGIRQFCGN